MSTEDDAPLEREAPAIWNARGERVEWMGTYPDALWNQPDITVSEITPERRTEILDEKFPLLPPKSDRYKGAAADRAEARLRSEIESFGVRERSGPPILGIVVIYVALVAAVGFAIWFAGNGYGWW